MRAGILKEYTLPSLTDAEWGYVAGIIDGEASLVHSPSYTSNGKIFYHYRISMTHTSTELLTWLVTKLGVGKIYERKMNWKLNNHAKKQQYHFDISPRFAVYRILLRIAPYLVEKQERALEMIIKFEEEFPQHMKGGKYYSHLG